ncbi:MAG: tetratricopeptide repeat protein [Chloroflexi bacterium]|nr:tetratricopeptide repeat protein [Chloroflexota bacterium]
MGAGGGPRILITTRDVSFDDARFTPSQFCAHIELGGLAMSDALDLAADVLNDNGIDRTRIKREDLIELMDRLGGHPLSLYLALPHLRRVAPRDLIAQFETLLPGFVNGAAKERNESLAVSLNYSLTRLGEQTRAALPALAVFQGGALEDDLLAITEIDAELWKTARAELQAAALVKIETLPNIQFPFLQFHPTLLPYLATQLDNARRAELQERYWKRYYDVARYLYQTDTQHPIEARAIVVREMPNLRRALDLALTAGAMDEAVNIADSIAKFLNNFGRWRERDAMMEKVNSQQSSVASDGKLTKAEYLLDSQRGDALRQQGHAAEAERLFRDLLKRMDAGAAYDVEYDRAMTHWRLGRCLAAQGRPAQAIEWHRQALQVFGRLSAMDKDAKKMWAVVQTDLAYNLAENGNFGEAEKEYEAAVKLAREVDDSRQVGVALGQLGTLAMQRGDLKTAHERYTDALNTSRALGEQQSEAIYLHQLGRVAQEAKQWDEAERCYRESLRLEEQMNHAEGVAQTCNQLACVAEGAGRLEDAERWYLRTIEYADYLPDKGAAVYNNLANLYLTLRRLDEAERYARRAVEIVEAYQVQTEVWKFYQILAQIADARGKRDEAVQWRRKSQDSFAAYAGAAYKVPQWAGQFVQQVVAAVQGNDEARKSAEQFLAQMENAGWGNLESAVRRILSGETDFEKLRDPLNRVEAYIVREILAGGQAPTPAPPPSAKTGRTGEGETAPSPAERGRVGVGVEQQGITLEQLLGTVVAACKPGAPAGLAEQLHALTRQMATDAQMSPEIRALGRALNQILSGERAPDVSALPQQLAEAVRGMLREIEE